MSEAVLALRWTGVQCVPSIHPVRAGESSCSEGGKMDGWMVHFKADGLLELSEFLFIHIWTGNFIHLFIYLFPVGLSTDGPIWILWGGRCSNFGQGLFRVQEEKKIRFNFLQKVMLCWGFHVFGSGLEQGSPTHGWGCHRWCLPANSQSAAFCDLFRSAAVCLNWRF